MSALRDGLFAQVPDVRVDDLVRRRARTISIKRLSKRELERGRAEYPPEERAAYQRPRTRGECLQGPHAARPCPFISCEYHLYLDINERSGSIKENFPGLEVWDMPETCALDIADRGGITLEEVGEVTNLTRERIRQMETRSLAAMRAAGGPALADLAGESPVEDVPRPRGTPHGATLVEDLAAGVVKEPITWGEGPGPVRCGAPDGGELEAAR